MENTISRSVLWRIFLFAVDSVAPCTEPCIGGGQKRPGTHGAEAAAASPCARRKFWAGSTRATNFPAQRIACDRVLAGRKRKLSPTASEAFPRGKNRAC